VYTLTIRSQISNLWGLRKQKYVKPQINRCKEIIHFRAEINEMENNRTIQRIYETSSRVDSLKRLQTQMREREREREREDAN
jgi:hypothetical protein